VSSQKPIDSNLFDKLLKEQAKPKGRRAKKIIDTTIRTYTLFFKMDRVHGIPCDNPECPDERIGTEKQKFISVVNIRGKNVCKSCFVAGYGSDNADER
jgi:hypothetical protein